MDKDVSMSLTNERVDDIPVLLEQLREMGVAELLDEHFGTHGHWRGLSLGQVAQVWLVHILSEANHRLNHVRPWVVGRIETLRGRIGLTPSEFTLEERDFTDDRLALVLHELSDDAKWEGFERSLNGRTIRVYDLMGKPGSEGKPGWEETGRVRVDGTTASHYGEITEGGLLQRGHSKDHRPDLGQLKIMLATLDPLGMPLVTVIAPGNRADDPLYVPTIRQVQAGLGRSGLLYVGDCKMMALATRAHLQATGDDYLGPLSEAQWPLSQREHDLAPVWNGEQRLTRIERPDKRGELQLVAEGFEIEVALTAASNGVSLAWTERRLLVRSLSQARLQEASLRERLVKAQTEIRALTERGRGKRRYREAGVLSEAAQAILRKRHVSELLELRIEEVYSEQTVRGYGTKPARAEVETELRLHVAVDEAAFDRAIRLLGWRAYATARSRERLSLIDAVDAYREEYLIERGFGRLKGKPLSLSPMYLARDDHATGLIRLLPIAVRVLTLVEFVARRALAKERAEIEGLYAGQPHRKTTRPTTEKLLKAFEGITLTVIHTPDHVVRHVTPLSPLHLRILHLLGFSPSIFSPAIPSNPP